MLELLRIRNYALIDDLELDFSPGFIVLTGETGAGKSILIDAISLILGGRASADAVRDGAAQANVEAVFRIDKPSPRLKRLLKKHELALEDHSLLISRVITAEGRSRAYVGGNLLTAAVLTAIGDEIVDLHGQHEHQSLLKQDRQLDLVDSFAGLESAAESVGEMAAKIRDLDKSIAQLAADDRDRVRRLDYLKHEAAEIESAGLQPDEEEGLKSRRNLIQNAENIANLAARARAALYEDEERPAIVAIDMAAAEIGELAKIDARFQPSLEQITAIRAIIEDVAMETRKFADGLDFDPQELDAINSRLVVIGDLKRKYGSTIEEILRYRQAALAEIDAYEKRDQRLAEAQAERDKIRQAADAAAAALSQKRKTAAKKLDKLVKAALQELGMKGGSFETTFEATPLSATGIDRVEFFLSANVGEKTKPLRHVASGGEISRIMLALKAVFAAADRIPTLIFDEIDAGVGGHIARKVADKLAGLAESHQVLCITHIAQIAAAARTHFRVEKSVRNGRTATSVKRMDPQARIIEIARLLDGSASELSVKHARALLGL